MTSKIKVLVTGFTGCEEGGDLDNPSELLCRVLQDTVLEGAEIETLVLPLKLNSIISITNELIARSRPNLVFIIGEFPGRSNITCERYAHNLCDFKRYDMKDQDGFQPCDKVIPSLTGQNATYLHLLDIYIYTFI